MMFLIDTNICIYIMNDHPPEVIQKFRDIGVGNIGISSITVSELQYGVSDRPKLYPTRPFENAATISGLKQPRP